MTKTRKNPQACNDCQHGQVCALLAKKRALEKELADMGKLPANQNFDLRVECDYFARIDEPGKGAL